MEYLQGRALTNAIGNLDIQDAYSDALKKLGHELEDIVEQVVPLWEPFYIFSYILNWFLTMWTVTFSFILVAFLLSSNVALVWFEPSLM